MKLNMNIFEEDNDKKILNDKYFPQIKEIYGKFICYDSEKEVFTQYDKPNGEIFNELTEIKTKKQFYHLKKVFFISYNEIETFLTKCSEDKEKIKLDLAFYYSQLLTILKSSEDYILGIHFDIIENFYDYELKKTGLLFVPIYDFSNDYYFENIHQESYIKKISKNKNELNNENVIIRFNEKRSLKYLLERTIIMISFRCFNEIGERTKLINFSINNRKKEIRRNIWKDSFPFIIFVVIYIVYHLIKRFF